MVQGGWQRFRIDGIEALVFAMIFSAVIMVFALTKALPVGKLVGTGAMASGFVGVFALRRVRPTRAAPAEDGEMVRPRSLLSLLALAIGWFIVLIGMGVMFIVSLMLADRHEVTAGILFAPVLPLAIGAACVVAGLPIGSARRV